MWRMGRLVTVRRMGKAGNCVADGKAGNFVADGEGWYLNWKMRKAGNRLADRDKLVKMKDRLMQTGQQFHLCFCAEK